MRLKAYCCTFILFTAISLQLRSQNSFAQYEIPDLFLSASNAVIHGNFDGNAENTTILFENGDYSFEAGILSESINEVTIETPPLPGIYKLIIDEAQSHLYLEETIRVAEMQLSVGKTNMRKGQKTQLLIQISGLDGYTKPILVEIKNLSPSTIKLPDGENEVIKLQNEGGLHDLTHELEIRAIARGGFNIEVNLKPQNVLIYYDPAQLEKEMNELLNDSSVLIAEPVLDSIKIIEDLAKHDYIPYPEAPRRDLVSCSSRNCLISFSRLLKEDFPVILFLFNSLLSYSSRKSSFNIFSFSSGVGASWKNKRPNHVKHQEQRKKQEVRLQLPDGQPLPMMETEKTLQYVLAGLPAILNMLYRINATP